MPKIKTDTGKIIHLPYTKSGNKKAKMLKKKYGIRNLKRK